MRSLPAKIGCCLALLVFVTSPSQAATFSEMVRRVPGEANAIVLIDAEALFASPLAQHEGWKKRQIANFADRPLSVPVTATKVLRAGHIDLHARDTAWEIAIIEAPRIPTIDQVAQREKGYVDQVANRPAAWSPRGAYAITVGDDALGLCFPPNRQFLARWIKERSGAISPYLLKASQSMEATDSQLMMAIDFEDSIEPARVDAWLKSESFPKIAGLDPNEAARIVSELRGVKLEVIFKDKPWGRLQLEFGSDPTPLVPIAAQLVVEGLRHAGASLDEVGGWKVSQQGNVVSLNGLLTEAGLMRLASVFELPAPDFEPEESSTVDKPALYATQSHFKSVNKLLDDLLDQKRDSKTMGQLAIWVGQYAKRIDRLSLVNVDKDMQEYSAGVAEDLREIAAALKGVGVRSGVRNANTYNTGSYGWGNYDGYYGNRAVSAERRAARAQERGQGTMTTMQLADQIRTDTSNIRRLMAERYKADF